MRESLPTRICSICEVEFTPNTKNQVKCGSNECNKEANRIARKKYLSKMGKHLKRASASSLSYYSYSIKDLQQEPSIDKLTTMIDRIIDGSASLIRFRYESL